MKWKERSLLQWSPKFYKRILWLHHGREMENNQGILPTSSPRRLGFLMNLPGSTWTILLLRCHQIAVWATILKGQTRWTFSLRPTGRMTPDPALPFLDWVISDESFYPSGSCFLLLQYEATTLDFFTSFRLFYACNPNSFHASMFASKRNLEAGVWAAVV